MLPRSPRTGTEATPTVPSERPERRVIRWHPPSHTDPEVRPRSPPDRLDDPNSCQSDRRAHHQITRCAERTSKQVERPRRNTCLHAKKEEPVLAGLGAKAGRHFGRRRLTSSSGAGPLHRRAVRESVELEVRVEVQERCFQRQSISRGRAIQCFPTFVRRIGSKQRRTDVARRGRSMGPNNQGRPRRADAVSKAAVRRPDTGRVVRHGYDGRVDCVVVTVGDHRCASHNRRLLTDDRRFAASRLAERA